jgi:peroxiredoxin
MKQDVIQFTDRMAQIVVIAPHETEKVKAYWEKEHIPFIGIPDPNGKIGKLYGQEWNLIKLGRMPALFIIDQKDTIAFSQKVGTPPSRLKGEDNGGRFAVQ